MAQTANPLQAVLGGTVTVGSASVEQQQRKWRLSHKEKALQARLQEAVGTLEVRSMAEPRARARVGGPGGRRRACRRPWAGAQHGGP